MSNLEELVKKYGDTIDKSEWFILSPEAEEPENETDHKDQSKETENKPK